MGTRDSRCRRRHLELRLHRQAWYTRWPRDTRVVLGRPWTIIGRRIAVVHMLQRRTTRRLCLLSSANAIRHRLTCLDAFAIYFKPNFSSFLLSGSTRLLYTLITHRIQVISGTKELVCHLELSWLELVPTSQSSVWCQRPEPCVQSSATAHTDRRDTPLRGVGASFDWVNFASNALG